MGEFQLGDTVRLKSGGPLMTIEEIGKDSNNKDKVWCVWFDKSVRKTDAFAPFMLDKDDDTPRVY